MFYFFMIRENVNKLVKIGGGRLLSSDPFFLVHFAFQNILIFFRSHFYILPNPT